MHLYKTIFPRVRSYVTKNSGNEEDALDIFQDAVVILCRQIKSDKFDQQYEIGGFLYSISRNLWINKAKREKKIKYVDTIIDILQNEDFTDSIMTKQKEKVLKTLIARLGERCFMLLKYAIYYKLSNKEICERMGFATDNSVKTQKYKCKQKLIGISNKDATVKEVLE